MVDRIIITCLVLSLAVNGAAVSQGVCSKSKVFNNQRRELFSKDYPLKMTSIILCKFHFNTSISGKLEVHDSGSDISKLRLDIWYKKYKWILNTSYPKEEIVYLPNSIAYDIYFHSPRIWFSFYENNEREPSNKVLKPCDKTTTTNCEQSILKYPDSQDSNKCLNDSTQLECSTKTPKQTAKNLIIIIISSLFGGLCLIMVALIWKRCRMSKHGTVQRRQTHSNNRPEVSSIYVNPNTIVNCELPQENEESHIYEKITSCIYLDPQAALNTVDSNDKLTSGLYCEPQTMMKNINSNDKLSGLYCEPQTTMKTIDNNDKLTSDLYCEPQTLKDVDKENSTPIYVNIL